MSEAIGLDDFVPWLAAQSAPEKDLQFFQRTPWTRKLVENPLFRPVPCPTRLVTPGTSHNAFIAKTINKPSCVQHWLMLARKEFATPQEVTRGSIAQSSFSPSAETYSTDDSEFIMLLEVGEDLDGFAGRVQGGVLSAILDEALSICVEYHRQASSSSRAPLYTVQLNTTYRDGVNTPGLIAVKSWLVAKEGRKWLIRGQICDAQGRVLTQAEGIWVSAAENKL